MSVERLIVLGGIAGAGYWAYRAGHFDAILDRLGGDGDSKSGGGLIGPVKPVSGVPAGSNRWEAVLRANMGQVQPWARANLSWVAAIIRQESGSQGSAARGGAGEIGLMQVKPATAEWMRNVGYGLMAPTVEVLATDAGGIYFGTAFLQHLSKIKSDRAWITKAYNGGPGWESLSATYKAARETYYREVLQKHGEMYGTMA